MQRKNSRKKSTGAGGRNSSGGSGSNQDGNKEKSMAEKERESGKKHLNLSSNSSSGHRSGRNKSGRESRSGGRGGTSKRKRKGTRSRGPSMSDIHVNIDKTFSSAPSKVAITKFIKLNLIVSTITTNSTLGETSFLNYAKRNR